MALIDDNQVDEALQQLSGWVRRGNRIEREFEFEGFTDAVSFLVRLAFDAEAADHHPDVTIHYRRLTLAYWTHDQGGVTSKDIEGARNAQRLAARWSDKGA